MCKSYLTELGKMDLPKGQLQKVFSYHWKDRPNERDYYVKVTEKGQLLSFTCCDKRGFVLHELDFTELDGRQNLWYLPTSKHPVVLNQANNIYYELGVPRPCPVRNEKSVFEEEEEKMKKEKIIWYEFSDEHNKRIYDVGFHEGGDLIGYRTYGKTKDEILIENPSSEDASCYCYEFMKMVGKFERVSDPDDKTTKVDSTSVTDDKDLSSKT